MSIYEALLRDPEGPVVSATATPRERQPRERSVPCRGCRRATWNVDAVCERCEDRLIAAGIHPAGSAR